MSGLRWDKHLRQWIARRFPLRPATLLHPVDDLAQRLPVWMAMSEFFLDTEQSKEDLQRIATICAASSYAADELEFILFEEVWPALHYNLLSVAGEWAYWEEAFVQERILSMTKARWSRRNWRFNPLRSHFFEGWPAVLENILMLRRGVTEGPSTPAM